MYQKLFSLSLLMTLSGCSVYKESFDCPIGKGEPCSSLSQVNNKMDKGTLKVQQQEAVSTSDTFFGDGFMTEGGGEN